MRRDRRLAYALMAYALSVMILLCVPRCAGAVEAPACVRDQGRVCCAEADFRLLPDRILELDAALARCEALRLPVPELPPITVPCVSPITMPIPARSPSRPLLGLGVGVASTVMLTAAVLAPWSPEVRASIGAAAIGGLTIGIVLVLP